MIKAQLNSVKSTLPSNVKLIAVSKTKPIELLLEAYEAKQLVFGENKVQELVDKYELLPKDIEWHFIGHLQSNKVKYIAPFVTLIHAIDSIKLLKEINKQAIKHDRIIDVLIQFHIADEDQKFGFRLDEFTTVLDSPDFFNLKNIKIIGIMGMATNTDDQNKIKKEFKSLNDIFCKLKSNQFKFANYFTEISMGMSSDYKLAIEAGSTMVRIGSTIFGARN